MVYLRAFTVKFQPCTVGKYTSLMDGMGANGQLNFRSLGKITHQMG